MRKFFSLGFKPEGRIGRAVELESDEIPGCTPENVREARVSGIPFAGFTTLTLAEARRLHSLPPDLDLTVARGVSDDLDFDVVVNAHGWKILSSRLGGAIKAVAPKDVELLPVPILGRNKEILRSDFCVVNILQMIDAISEAKTVRSRNGKSIFKLAIVGAKVPADVHVFRVKGCQYDFIIDELVKQSIVKLPHDGLAFSPIEQE